MFLPSALWGQNPVTKAEAKEFITAISSEMSALFFIDSVWTELEYSMSSNEVKEKNRISKEQALKIGGVLNSSVDSIKSHLINLYRIKEVDSTISLKSLFAEIMSLGIETYQCFVPKLLVKFQKRIPKLDFEHEIFWDKLISSCKKFEKQYDKLSYNLLRSLFAFKDKYGITDKEMREIENKVPYKKSK
jgi:hypothetical protein